MRTTWIALVALWMLPTRALAHGGGHAPDPNLHVDPKLDDCEVHFAPELSQKAFRRFVREFGTVSAFKPGAAPTTLGRWGVSLGLEYMWFHVEEHDNAWNDTFAHPDAEHELGSNLAFPKLKARLGVGDHTDVGAYYTMNPRSNYGWIGFDVKHALLREDDGMPLTLSVRGAYTKTLFVDDMDMHALTAEALAGRTFWEVLTPYAGIGTDLMLARETARSVNLDTVAVLAPHVLAGLRHASGFWRSAQKASTRPCRAFKCRSLRCFEKRLGV